MILKKQLIWGPRISALARRFSVKDQAKLQVNVETVLRWGMYLYRGKVMRFLLATYLLFIVCATPVHAQQDQVNANEEETVRIIMEAFQDHDDKTLAPMLESEIKAGDSQEVMREKMKKSLFSVTIREKQLMLQDIQNQLDSVTPEQKAELFERERIRRDARLSQTVLPEIEDLEKSVKGDLEAQIEQRSNEIDQIIFPDIGSNPK